MISVLSAGRDCPTELRERLAMDDRAQRDFLAAAPRDLEEVVVLCTCHRTEIYASSPQSPGELVHTVAGLLPLRPDDHSDLRLLSGLDAVEHLFRVACGLDSLVTGEPQVLGQVRRAWVRAQHEGRTGPVLANVFSRALRLGRRMRADTDVGRLARSLGSLGAARLEAELSSLSQRRGCVVGTGEAASDAARALASRGAALTIVGRTPENAAALAARFEAESRSLDELESVLASCDFAMVATGGGTVLRSSDVGQRPLVIVDLSVPRGVDVADRPDVKVITIDDLDSPDDPGMAQALREAEEMVRAELEEFDRWTRTRGSGESIRQLRERAEAMVRAELQRTLAGMELTPEQADRVAAMAMRLANKMLHAPSAALRDADPDTRAQIERIFGL